jgi:UDP-N-acetylmuramoyl-L-alanyl-D-glutamate--2,6-diaminopimelate ligase
MNLGRLIAALSPTDVVDRAPEDVTDLVYDARQVEAGALFFCVRGERADGHEFALAAVDRGAVALVVERVVPGAGVPQVVVGDSRAAMGGAADAFFGHPTRELEVAGVTGTNGKTTTAHLLHSVLEAAGRRPGLLGTVESRIGDERRPAVRTTAEAIDLQRAFRAMLDAGNRSCAMEATSHGSQLKRLVGVRFAALVFTNLTREHLDFHGTMERYFEAKRRLFVGEDAPPAAVNVDDAYGRRLADELRARDAAPLLTFALEADADVRGAALELDARGATFRAAGIPVRTSIPGRFNVLNALGTIAAARLLGIGNEEIALGIENLDRVPGRFELVDEGQPFAVVVDYSHKPDALAGVLRAARDLARERVICVFGCGGDRDRGKRPLMGRIASELADIAVVTSDNPRTEEPRAIIDEILEGADGDAELEVEPDRRAAIARAIGLARDGDVVVIAGKGHETTQEVGDQRLPFDDREVAREALRRLGAAA